jgi:imidazolonepropionase
MPLLKNISILYTCRPDGGQAAVHPIKNAALAWNEENIKWVGSESGLPVKYQKDEIVDAEGAIVVPGFIDCHTHLCFGGWRSDEFEMRVQGKSYLEIAKAGGGILSTVKATRKATEDELFEKASALLQKISELGVTTIECKSGYGLSPEDELKQLRVYKRLKNESRLTIVSTFLGAHTFPPEFKNNRTAYIDLIVNEMIPAVADEKLADFCDVFVEDSAFTIEEARQILETGKQYGLQPKLHADQLTSGGGAELAAEIQAVSADHLEQISENGIQKMAKTGVVGVTLPIASLYTQQPYLNCRRLVDGGVEVAVATDFNPGSAPSFDLQLAMMLTCNHGRLTPSESLKAATYYAAKALNLHDKTGSLEKGKQADFVLLDVPDINFWLYHFNRSAVKSSYVKGERVN